jgi:hypothetical protein
MVSRESSQPGNRIGMAGRAGNGSQPWSGIKAYLSALGGQGHQWWRRASSGTAELMLDALPVLALVLWLPLLPFACAVRVARERKRSSAWPRTPFFSDSPIIQTQ